MSVHEFSSWQCDVREPFQSVGLVCKCGKAVAGIEGVVTTCANCGTAYIVSVMQLRHAAAPATTEPQNSEGDPVEVHPPQSRAERQAESNGPSGSPTSPSGRVSKDVAGANESASAPALDEVAPDEGDRSVRDSQAFTRAAAPATTTLNEPGGET